MNIQSEVEVFDQLVQGQRESHLKLEKFLEEIKVEFQSIDVEAMMPTFCRAARFLAEKAEKNEGVIISLLVAFLGFQRLPSEDNQLPKKQVISPDVEKSIYQDFVEKATEVMHKHLMSEKPITLSRLCEDLGTNATTLSDCFKRELQTSPIKYWKQLRLERAAKLLTETRLSVFEISMQCLYETQGSFSTAFRQQYNQTPSDYRRKHGKHTA